METLKQIRIAEGSKARLLRLRIDLFNRDMEGLVRSVMEGRITLGFFEEEMRTQLRLLHTGAMAIGKGSWLEVTSSDWGRVGASLRQQYQFLHNFIKDIYDRRETITEEMIAWRAKLYGLKAAHTATLGQAGDMIGYLPWMPKDGSTRCLNGCMCTWEFSETSEGAPSGMKIVQATWTLHPSEHCETCLDREGHTVPIELSEDLEVPTSIGL